VHPWLRPLIVSLATAEYTEHGGFFTVGSMRRSLDVFAASGEPIAHLFDPELSVRLHSSSCWPRTDSGGHFPSIAASRPSLL
jgi:hypothetical protein